MTQFTIVPLSREYARRIRARQRDDFGNAITQSVAAGTGPCRVSLRRFAVGVDERLLLQHTPFTQQNAYNQSGPIFIHAEDVAPYADVHRFPPELKNDPVNLPLTLIGYSAEQRMVNTKLVGERDVDALLSEMLSADPRIAYIHVRNVQAGCYICKVERTPTKASQCPCE